MKKLTARDLFALQYGDTVHLKGGSYLTSLQYVGRLPSSENYLIFASGESLRGLYINPNDGSFKGDWFGGEYDEKMVIELQKELSELQDEIKDFDKSPNEK